MVYNPQGLKDTFFERTNRETVRAFFAPRPSHKATYTQTSTNYPGSVLYFPNDTGAHPTQKPVALFEYLIRTYTDEGQTVLDNTMGSGTTGVACVRTGRRFIGIEQDAGYYEIARKRIQEEYDKTALFNEAAKHTS